MYDIGLSLQVTCRDNAYTLSLRILFNLRMRRKGRVMYRKKKPDTYIEPMPKKEFRKIMKDFKSIGGIVVMGDEVDEYLALKKAEACTVDGYTILFSKNPGRASVHEELIHAAQFRDGKNDGSIVSILQNEIAAQQVLISNAAQFQLTDKEIYQTQCAVRAYKEALHNITKKGDDLE